MKKTLLILFFSLFFSGINLSFGQTVLNAGDIAFIGLNSDGNDDFSFILLKDIEAGTIINFTDKGWNDGSGFFNASGDPSALVWTATSNLNKGQIVHIQTTIDGATSPGSLTASEGSVSGEIVISYIGDQLFAYQGTEASPTFIAGIHWNVLAGTSTSGNWDGTAASNSTSALPDQLTNGVNAIWVYAPEETEKDKQYKTQRKEKLIR